VAFAISGRAGRWINARPRLHAWFERPRDATAELPPGVDAQALRGHVILIGFGRVGSAVSDTLAAQRITYVVIEQNRDLVEAGRARGVPIFYGDAARPGVLTQAHVAHARLLVVATPDPFQTRAIIDLAKRANPAIDTVARAHSESERAYLERNGVALALIGEHELALGLGHYALVHMGCSEDAADATVNAIRRRPRSRRADTLATADDGER
jgi:CPA2 family monovalent cation:H+ antiporter-2